MMPKRSKVWDFYDKQPDSGVCKICKSKVKRSGNTSNLHSHLRNSHELLYAEKFDKLDTTDQTDIATSFKNIQSVKSGHFKEQIDMALFWWIISDCRPFKIVESAEFVSFIKSLNSQYVLPKRKAVTSNILRLYKTKKELVVTHLKTIEMFSLTSDIWTDQMNSRSYIGLTLHYLDGYEQKSICIGARNFDESHTAINIADIITSILSDYDIPMEKVISFTTDSASNMIAAVNHLSIPHVKCVAHRINLLVLDSMEESESLQLTSKVKNIVTFFKQSNLANNMLREEQIKDSVEPLKLKQDCCTRWNSTFFMLERYLFLRNYVSIALRKLNREDLDINYDEIEILNDMVKCLNHFYKMTNDIMGEKYITISRVIPLVTGVNFVLEKTHCKTERGLKLKAALQDNLEKRFGMVEKNEIFAFSTLLDPRFKKIDFRSPLNCSHAVTKLNEKLRVVPLTQEIQQPVDVEDLWSYHESRVRSLCDASYGLNSGLKHYFELVNLAIDDNPLNFWKNNKGNWHHLHNLALKYLNIPATSVPCERLFSKTGSIISEKRNRIKPELVDALCFLESLPIMFR
ncbi:zinc finger BED domain-containing protein 1-like [Tetranychus urticae]|uniref:zinc finger BED domain-containing protein 1-like n=1 Tax=Tetranychus urticae TaxID=32264 RepID=UPI00077B9B39|nr:zinc finger BED domain-containing protein 1-like [Tetranychus urticae]